MNLQKTEKIFDILALISVPIGLYFAFIYAPMEIKMGAIQKIFYFHVASAWVGFFAFFITFIMSILFLFTKNFKFDDIAEASAFVGVIFCTIVIVTGPLWAKPTWGVYWTWDPRLTSTLILLFTYLFFKKHIFPKSSFFNLLHYRIIITKMHCLFLLFSKWFPFW